ncbi:hypothetical protein K440DRAFT_24866 [Wilcoxina mikolae CBS 423.85]|nr:hypothetical protein K440DRAFT_24866 [Wilcoxina mikolae CBS 423.85]
MNWMEVMAVEAQYEAEVSLRWKCAGFVLPLTLQCHLLDLGMGIGTSLGISGIFYFHYFAALPAMEQAASDLHVGGGERGQLAASLFRYEP